MLRGFVLFVFGVAFFRFGIGYGFGRWRALAAQRCRVGQPLDCFDEVATVEELDEPDDVALDDALVRFTDSAVPGLLLRVDREAIIAAASGTRSDELRALFDLP